jgi:hypothetical protein
MTTTTDQPDLGEVYLRAVEHRDAVRQNPSSEQLGTTDSYRRAASAIAVAEDGVRQARAALEATRGPGAVRLVDAQANQRAIAGELIAARNSRRAPEVVAELASRERVAAQEVEQLAAVAEQERGAIDARDRLEVDNAPLLDALEAELIGSRAALVNAVRAAEAALAKVRDQAEAHQDAVSKVHRCLVDVGFGAAPQVGGRSFPTTTNPLSLKGSAWPSIPAGSILAWTMSSAAVALGPSGVMLASAVRRQVGLDAYKVDALLAEVNKAGK